VHLLQVPSVEAAVLLESGFSYLDVRSADCVRCLQEYLLLYKILCEESAAIDNSGRDSAVSQRQPQHPCLTSDHESVLPSSWGWDAAGASCNEHLNASAASAVRTPEEFAEGHAPGAVNIPFFFRGPAGAGRGTQQLMQQEQQEQQQLQQ